MKDELNPKQARFVAEYLKDSNGKQSAIRAGYAPKNAEITASQLLRLSKVQKVLKLKVDAIEKKCGLSREWVTTRLMSIADRCMSDTEFDPSGANRTLELLGKTQAMFTDRTEMSGELAVKGLQVSFVKVEVIQKQG